MRAVVGVGVGVGARRWRLIRLHHGHNPGVLVRYNARDGEHGECVLSLAAAPLGFAHPPEGLRGDVSTHACPTRGRHGHHASAGSA